VESIVLDSGYPVVRKKMVQGLGKKRDQTGETKEVSKFRKKNWWENIGYSKQGLYGGHGSVPLTGKSEG